MSHFICKSYICISLCQRICANPQFYTIIQYLAKDSSKLVGLGVGGLERGGGVHRVRDELVLALWRRVLGDGGLHAVYRQPVGSYTGGLNVWMVVVRNSRDRRTSSCDLKMKSRPILKH